MHGAVAELVELVGEALEEVAVVGDDDEGTRILEEGILEDVLGVHVEVVGRLVEDEEVGGCEQQLGQCEAGFFAAGEHLDLLLAVLAVEEEGAKDVAYLGADVARSDVVDSLEDRLLAVEHGGLVLGVVAELDLGAKLEGAGVVLDVADDDLGHGGLTLAVLAHEGDLLARSEEEVDAGEDLQVAVGLAQLVGLDDDLAAMRRGGEAEMDALGADLVDLHGLHLVEHLDAALHLLGLGGLVAETLDESLDLRHLALLGGKLSHLRSAAFLHLHHIFGIGTFVVVDAAGGDLDGAVGDIVEERAVMGDEHHGARIVLEERLEPLDALDVEVVGRLVEEEEVGLAQEELGQFDAHLPAAAELGHGAGEVAMAESESEEHLLGHLLALVAAEKGDLLGDVVVAVEEPGVVVGLVVGALGNLVGEPFLESHEVVDAAEGGEGLVDNGAGGVGDHLLGEVADLLAGGDDHGARLGLLPAAEDLEERRLAGAVLAHEANAVVVGDVEGDVVEQVGAGELHR